MKNSYSFEDMISLCLLLVSILNLVFSFAQ